MKPDLSVNIAGIETKNPIMPASGTFGYGEEMSKIFDLSLLGAVLMKTTTLEPRKGNDPPRIGETDSGMINSIGLQNPGVCVVVKKKIPFLKQFNVPIIASIGGRTIADYIGMARKLSQAEHLVSAIEVNISCPNTAKGGIAFGQDPDIAFEIIHEVKRVTHPEIKVIAKLTPNITDITVIARAVVLAGADVVSLINTVKARVKIRKLNDRKKWLWLNGGLSGPAIKPIALSMVYQVAQADLGVPIIGIGGIRNTSDVIDFLECGATAVQIGTATFIHPTTMIDVIKGLARYMKEKGYKNIQKLKKGKVQ